MPNNEPEGKQVPPLTKIKQVNKGTPSYKSLTFASPGIVTGEPPATLGLEMAGPTQTHLSLRKDHCIIYI